MLSKRVVPCRGEYYRVEIALDLIKMILYMAAVYLFFRLLIWFGASEVQAVGIGVVAAISSAAKQVVGALINHRHPL